MKVIEEFIQGKANNSALCEDAIFVSNDFVAVIDGATSKSERLWDGKTSGKIASQILQQKMADIPRESTAEKAALLLNDAIANWYKSQKCFELMAKNPVERATASILIYSRYQKQIWFIGDCQSMIDNTLITNMKPIDTLIENLRAFYLEYELLNGKSIQDLLDHDTGRDAVVPFIAKQTYLQNADSPSEFVYDVIDGFFSRMQSIKICDVPEKAKHLVLASDGYPSLKNSLEKSEAALAEILAEDPLCFRKFRSTKGIKKGNVSYDDRAYVKIALQ